MPLVNLPRVKVQCFAPGKVVLLGEHAIAAGHPALAATLPRGSTVFADASDSFGITVESEHGNRAQLEAAAQLVGAHLGIFGARVRVRTDLPVGQGLGGLAAFSVALCRALGRLSGRELPLSELCALAHAAQGVFARQSSGVDTEAAAIGGALRVLSGPPPRVEPLVLARPAMLVVALAAADSTARTQAEASARRLRDEPARFGWLLERLGEHSQRGAAELTRGDLAGLGARLEEVHALLAASGLSTPGAERSVSILRGAGVRGAKLASSAGAVVALVDEVHPALSALHDHGVAAFSLCLDAARFAA